MKTTGIVRRLDELGRIVIPREYRKTHKINIGDPLEITALEDGSIVISKVDFSGELDSVVKNAVSNLNAELSALIVASDLSKWIAGSGTGKSNFLERELPHSVMRMLKDRRTYNGLIDSDKENFRLSDTGFMYMAMAPIMGSNDCFGGLFFLSNEEISAHYLTTLRIAGRLIGESLQKY